MPQLEKNIISLYHNPDLLLEASKSNGESKNLAVDVSSLIKVIKLVDCEFNYGGGRVLVSGESYLMPFITAEKAVKSRKKINLVGVNVYPLIVDEILEGEDWEEVVGGVEAKERKEFREWMNKKGLEEISNFAQICKERTDKNGNIDSGGIVLTQGVNPILALKRGYEIDGVYNPSGRIGKLELPLEIATREAEFRFLSRDHVKISDGDESIGKYKEGILTLEDAEILVSDVKDEIKRNVFERRMERTRTAENLMVGLGIGICGWIGAFVLGGVSYLSCKTLGLPTDWITPFSCGIGSSLSLLGLIGGISMSYEKSKEGSYELVGECLMKTAFYGKVKGKKFENMETLLSE